MSQRQHTVEETIVDQIPRALLAKLLKDTGRIPKDWTACSILVHQEDASKEITVTVKRSYAGP